jgi:hypothetical protein
VPLLCSRKIGKVTWARALGVSHTWLQRLVREFKQDSDEMWQLQVALGDPTFDQLSRAREYTQELRNEGKVRPPRRRRRVILEERLYAGMLRALFLTWRLRNNRGSPPAPLETCSRYKPNGKCPNLYSS